ncbi:unnamed protein product [Urochloa humidicola]
MSCGRQSQGRRRTSSSGGGEGVERWWWHSIPTASRTLWSSIQELDGMKRLLKARDADQGHPRRCKADHH